MSGTIFPFPAASGVGAPPRPPAPAAANRDDFTGAMDDALEAREPRRADSASRPARRPDVPRAREAARRDVAEPTRNPNTSKPAARAGRSEAATGDVAVERRADTPHDDTVVAADQQETTSTETQPETVAVAHGGDQAAGGGGDVAAETPAIGDPAPLVEEGNADDEAEAGIDGSDPLARGRRWTASDAAPSDAQGDATARGVARRPDGAPGHGLTPGHVLQRLRAEGNTAPVAELMEVAKSMVAAAHAEAEGAEATGEPVAQAVESAAAKPQTASAASAATAIETAASVLETVAAVEAAAETNTGEAPTQEHAQAKPHAANTPPNTGAAVAVTGVDAGVKFTVNSAAGHAAYASAAPRAEETVLPQIVQSIRLHAVQGVSEARVQLKPEHLGNLNITLKVEHNQVTATIQADVAAVRQWIESHEATLRQSLAEQGLQLARLEVHPDGQQAPRDEQGSDHPRRQPRRRAWRGDDATFEVLV